MKAKEPEQRGLSAGDARLGGSRSAVKEHGAPRGAPSADALARAKAIARWENEGGRVVPATRERAGRS
jgi:hypothetical protein